ncbi:hypothetical protein [Streptomyces fradiae]|jgi:hypothetical protein|uniref:Uncharacterized protein n=3 Tax=Streptomyces TaxID=1883 RepID=A0A1D8FYG6_9ACTN|nr:MULTISPECIES: hypothetical protein [Streptomyces]KAF0647994.1 hypothetical protein K701_20395 [Streptomyces fradiae ATCC 10745 = DSM 40063]AOT58231.1 hypothetical protein A4G23_01038 [Streptomyces rubrolavendulae]OSY52261.1 hypothetical protein BG846_02101 [Streptomyces fradiae ATCC 10745 = DSM 40063]QEV11536.1 hypothetical protein CP974_05385 [Streptomyces fradiae ATCC 10745 = DSM 40063]UQS28762.1 hypothetical protein J5J01_17105 [Streptomyces fradiae]
MPARTPTRTHPVAPAPAAGAEVRLPWWAIALPVAAFTALFLLLAGSGQARATEGQPAVGRFLEQVRHTVAR